MAHSEPVHDMEASAEVRKVYDDIKQTREVDEVNNFWKFLANHPTTLWFMRDCLKEMIQVAVSLPTTANSASNPIP